MLTKKNKTMKTISFEKLSFESSDILSRLQMKKVKGGHQSTCTWSWAPGYSGSTPTTTCSGAGENCQDAADAFCLAHDECLDVDCR